MFSSQTQAQLPVANNAPEIIPGTWEAIMEQRRITKPSRLISPYIPVTNITEKLRQWYPFGSEGIPPGFAEGGDGPPFFHLPLFQELIRIRKVIAGRMASSSGLPYRFNFENGQIDLPPRLQGADSRPLKRKRSHSRFSSPAAFSSARQVQPLHSFPYETHCMWPSEENLEYMKYMNLMKRLDRRRSSGTSSSDVRLPSASHERSAAEPERRSRAPCSPPGPGSSRERTPRHSEERSDSTSRTQAPQPRPPKPPVPLYPWK